MQLIFALAAGIMIGIFLEFPELKIKRLKSIHLVLGFFAFGIVISGYMLIQSIHAQATTKEYNIQQLAWEIKKGTGINCGGYYETDGTPQKCSITDSNMGLMITLDDDIKAKRPSIDQIVSNHIPEDVLPSDYPIAPTSIPVPTLKEKYQNATTAQEKLDILAEAAGLK